MDGLKLPEKHKDRENPKMRAKANPREQKPTPLIRRSILMAGMAVLALILIILMNNLLGSELPPKPVIPETKNSVQVAQVSAAGASPAHPASLLENSNPPLFGTISGFSGDVESVVYSGDRISTQEVGKRIVVGIPKGSLSTVYLFANSVADVLFQDWVQVNLMQGNVYVQPGEGSVEEVQLPHFHNATARVQGSRMVVRLLDNNKVRVECYEGQCEFRFSTDQAWNKVSVGAARIFNLANGQAGNETLMTFTEMWDSNIGCGFCLTAILPDPTNTPFPTLTATPTILLPTTAVGATSALQPSSQNPPAPPTATQAPVIAPATSVPPTQVIPPTQVPSTQAPPQTKPNKQPPQPKPNPGPPHPKKTPPSPGTLQNFFGNPNFNSCNSAKNPKCN